MKNFSISIKAIIIALVIQIIINMLFAILVFASMDSFFQDIGKFNENNIITKFFSNPKVMLLLFLEIVLSSGLPGYLAARIANKNFALHGTVIGIISVVWTIRTVLHEAMFPVSIGIILLLLGFISSIIGGWYRGYQKKIS